MMVSAKTSPYLCHKNNWGGGGGGVKNVKRSGTQYKKAKEKSERGGGRGMSR